MANEIVNSQQRSFAAIQGYLNAPENQKAIAKVLRPGHTGLKADVIVRAGLMAIKKQPALLNCTPQSIFHSLLVLSAVGLDPTVGTGKAWLIPRKGECCPQFGYKGLLDLAYRHPLVKSINVQLVFVGEVFKLNPTSILHPIIHEPDIDGLEQSEETLRGGYAMAALRGSNAPIVRWLSKKDIEKRRASSAARGDFSPWKTHYLAMARKTVLTALIQGGTVPTAEEMVTFATVEQHLDDGGSMADRAALGLPEDLGDAVAAAPISGSSETSGVVDAVVTETPTPEDRSKFKAAGPDDAKAAWTQACIESSLIPEDAADLVRRTAKEIISEAGALRAPKLVKFDHRTAGNGELLAAANLLAERQKR